MGSGTWIHGMGSKLDRAAMSAIGFEVCDGDLEEVLIAAVGEKTTSPLSMLKATRQNSPHSRSNRHKRRSLYFSSSTISCIPGGATSRMRRS